MISKIDKLSARDIWCWALEICVGAYDAPELMMSRLSGVVALHKGRKNQKVSTSRMVEVDGRYIKTRSGTTYLLGKVNPEYRQWWEAEGNEWNEENPIKVIK